MFMTFIFRKVEPKADLTCCKIRYESDQEEEENFERIDVVCANNRNMPSSGPSPETPILLDDTSVGSMENFIYYEYLDKVLGEIQPKLYETEQDMKGKMEDKKAHKKTYSKSRELLYENDDQEIPVIKIDRELPVPKIDRGLPVPKIDRGLTWTKEETITLIQIWSNPDIPVRVVTS